MTSIKKARQVKERLKVLLKDNPNINGIGITEKNKQYVVKVNLKSNDVIYDIPKKLDGVDIIIEIIPEFKPR